MLAVYVLLISAALTHNDNHEHNSQAASQPENLKIAIYRYSPTDLPSCEERLNLITHQYDQNTDYLPVCMKKTGRSVLI